MIPILDVWGQVWQIFYGIFVKLDVWVYKIAGACFDLIRNIYNFDFFSGGTLISEIKNRIYLALGIIMVFRIILAGVQYIVNPDTFDDKEKGMVGILKNALITVLLIAIVPAIFEFALDIQDDIVKEIPNLIFGKTETEVNYTVVNRDGKEENKTANVSSNDNIKGEDIAFSVLQGFISPAKDENNNKKDSNAGVGLNDNYEIHNIETFEKYATKNMNNGLDKASYSYMVIISTLGGGFLVYILASMAFDVAIRTIKLGIIQMLSPIPISSYMFKKENFNKFIKTSFKVYTDLFIRMLVIYVIILVVQILVNSGILDLGRSTDDIFDFLRNIILIFGLLMFAKSAPKFITELLGLPDVTSGDMADMFKRAGGVLGAGAAAGRRYIAARANARQEAIKDAGHDVNSDAWKQMSRKDRNKKIKDAIEDYNKKNPRKNITRQALRSAGSAYRTGMYQAITKNKGYKDAKADGIRAGERSYDLNKALADNGVTRKQYYTEVAKRRMGIDSNLDVMNTEIEAAKTASDKSKAALDWAHNNRGAKLSNLRFDDEFVNANGNKQFIVGIDSQGQEARVSLSDMSVNGQYSINTVENQLKSTIEDKDGRLKNMGLAGQEIISKAQAALDELQGLGDTFAVNASRRDDTYKAQVGYKDNPAFNRAIQEAIEADIMHSTDTQFGRDVQEAALAKGIARMENGKFTIVPEHTGDWIALNKKMGQDAQTANIAAKGTQGAAATVKSIADKYDKKSS